MKKFTRSEVFKSTQVTLMEQACTVVLPSYDILLKDICPDSLDRVEVLMELEDDLGIRLADSFMNKHKNSTILSFADALYELLPNERQVEDGGAAT